MTALFCWYARVESNHRTRLRRTTRICVKNVNFSNNIPLKCNSFTYNSKLFYFSFVES
nr:MAG TPA: hypothetical protein [Caudoviricetes sp.]